MKCFNVNSGTENSEGAMVSKCCVADSAEASQVVCPVCGRNNPAGYTKCRRCGYEPVELKCHLCGNIDVEIDDAFCWKCKAKLHLGGGCKHYANCQVGEHFFFGSYPQGKRGEVQTIEWRVLAREGDRLLVVTEYGLDCKKYSEKNATNAYDWSQCTLRSWLNGEFMEKAFSAEERGSFVDVMLTNPYRATELVSMPSGPDTCDKLFLLSMDEVKRYFSSEAERCCKATRYVMEQYHDGAIYRAQAGICDWWLRTAKSINSLVAEVDSDGRVYFGQVSFFNAVRPAAFLAL